MTLSKFSQYKIIKIENDVVITNISEEHVNHWHCWKLIFCTHKYISYKYNQFLDFHKDMLYGSIQNKQIIFKVNNKSTKKKCNVLPKVNQNIQTT